MADLELIQFPYSHYNEKIRWALDYKRPEHIRTNLVPGPHAMTTMRVSGQMQVPVMRFGSDYVAGSATILDQLERRYPEPPLYPADPAERDRAIEVQRYFDDEVGPMVRRGLFAVLTQERDYLCGIFTADRSPLFRSIYRAIFPVTRAVMKSSMGITDRASIERGVQGTEEGLAFVARESAATGYLVGSEFGIADLAAASLLAPAVIPDDSPMSLPRPRPERIELWLAKWADHPGAEWVRNVYGRHRGSE